MTTYLDKRQGDGTAAKQPIALRRLRCAFGFHRWRKWSVAVDWKTNAGIRSFQNRECADCGKQQERTTR